MFGACLNRLIMPFIKPTLRVDVVWVEEIVCRATDGGRRSVALSVLQMLIGEGRLELYIDGVKSRMLSHWGFDLPRRQLVYPYKWD